MLTAQTYHYVGVSKVDANEVRHQFDGTMYITFTNNKARLYQSDKNGNIPSQKGGYFSNQNNTYTDMFELAKTGNNMYVYTFVIPSPPASTGNPYLDASKSGAYSGVMKIIREFKKDQTTYTFSSDYKRLNIRTFQSGEFAVFVYERKEKEDISAPDFLY